MSLAPKVSKSTCSSCFSQLAPTHSLIPHVAQAACASWLRSNAWLRQVDQQPINNHVPARICISSLMFTVGRWRVPRISPIPSVAQAACASLLRTVLAVTSLYTSRLQHSHLPARICISFMTFTAVGRLRDHQTDWTVGPAAAKQVMSVCLSQGSGACPCALRQKSASQHVQSSAPRPASPPHGTM